MSSEAVSNQDSTLPPLCDLDMGVIASLPPELFSEINDIYGGKLASLISKNKGKSVGIGSLCGASSESFEGNFPIQLIYDHIVCPSYNCLI